MKGLEGVDQRLLDKLEGAGVQSVSDLATSTASELLEEYYDTFPWPPTQLQGVNHQVGSSCGFLI